MAQDPFKSTGDDETRLERTPIERLQLARHDRRPHALDLIGLMCEEFMPLHGDRKFMDDRAMIGGWALFRDRPVMVIAHQKGRQVRERVDRNYGMPKPEGYRKAVRLMKMAEKFDRPVLTLIDTPGAFPGIDAEERGQAEAIAEALREMSRLRVPVIVTISGEGGSGGALAIGVGDAVLMLENAVYSVISPEGCAAILWKDAGPSAQAQAAASLRITSGDMLALGVIDEIVPEPPGGAHEDWELTAQSLSARIAAALERSTSLDREARLERRYAKFRALGAVRESG